MSIESRSGNTAPKIVNVRLRIGKEEAFSRTGNYHSKIFDDPIYISVPEDTPVGTHIYDIAPKDDNIFKKRSTFNFELFDQMPRESFELSNNPHTSKSSIRLIRLLDYELDQRYVMTVRVTAGEKDDGGITFSTLLTVIVQVKDVNDITPAILSTDSLSIYSDVNLRAPLMKVIAADEDSGEAGRISYKIVGGNTDGTFHVSIC